MMGSEGSVVQADSTWCPKGIRPHSGRGGLKPSPASGRSCATVAGSALSLIYTLLVAAGGSSARLVEPFLQSDGVVAGFVTGGVEQRDGLAPQMVE